MQDIDALGLRQSLVDYAYRKMNTVLVCPTLDAPETTVEAPVLILYPAPERLGVDQLIPRIQERGACFGRAMPLKLRRCLHVCIAADHLQSQSEASTQP